MWQPKATRISDVASIAYDVVDDHAWIGGFGRSHAKMATMSFACRPADDEDAVATIVMIRSDQTDRNGLKAGYISGVVAKGDATVLQLTRGTCAGKHQRAGMISWILGK